ncbi:MAG: alpha/beta hydrolase, partial [Patescibacteria group bacterium]
MKFLLFHGAFGSPGSNWLPELKDKLESLGQEVIAPAFPVETWEYITRTGDKISSQQQNLDNWLAEFDKVYKTFRKGEKLVFIGHSLGPLFILHIVERYNIKVDCAIFVCPFLEKLHKSWQIDHVNQSFYKTNFDFRKLKKLIPVSYVLYSNDDPYVDQKYSELFGNALASSMILLKRAGHMNSEVNLNDFPLIMDLCITRLELPLYQRYLSLKEKLGLTEYVEKTKG